MEDFLVFDLETQRSADEVGGWANIPDMKMSVGVLWDSRKNDYCVYYEDQIFDLIEHLQSGPVVIGYNHIGFDYPVLGGYYPKGPERLKVINNLNEPSRNLDLLIDVRKQLGKRMKLDNIARATLKIGKSADGLMALKWYKEYLEGDKGKLIEIMEYCKQDVEVTRDVFLYGVKHGEVFYDDRNTGIKSFKVKWDSVEEEEAVEVQDDTEQLSF